MPDNTRRSSSSSHISRRERGPRCLAFFRELLCRRLDRLETLVCLNLIVALPPLGILGRRGQSGLWSVVGRCGWSTRFSVGTGNVGKRHAKACTPTVLVSLLWKSALRDGMVRKNANLSPHQYKYQTTPSARKDSGKSWQKVEIGLVRAVFEDGWPNNCERTCPRSGTRNCLAEAEMEGRVQWL